MFKKDYLQRRIEEFGKALAKLASRRKEEEYQRELESLGLNYLGIGFSQLEEMSPDALIRNFPIIAKDRIALKIAADLLYESLQKKLEEEQQSGILEQIKKCSYLYHCLQEDLTEQEFDLGVHHRLTLLSELAQSGQFN